jgi:flagellin
MASFSVVNNVAAANAQANLVQTNNGLKTALTRLSSGLRINSSGDDAAGLAVANSYRSTVAVLNQGIRNANDGLSKLQIKDGALNNISNLLDRLATLATQSASSASSLDRGKLNDEFVSVVKEIDREASVAGLTGSSATAFSVFVSNDSTNGTVGGTIAAANASTLAVTISSTFNVASDTAAAAAVATVASAVVLLGTAQGNVGALENRLQFAIGLAQSQSVNTQAAESRIRDANIAEESANMTKFNILTQSGIAALSQANQSSQAVLSLLR